MNPERKKELLEEYRNRKPEMGIIAIKCKDTNDLFLDKSKDTNVAFNGIICRLNSSWHPNKRLQELWNIYGENGFDYYIERRLKYDNPLEDQSKKLEELLEKSLEENKGAIRLWK